MKGNLNNKPIKIMETIKLAELSIDELSYINIGITLLMKAHFDQEGNNRQSLSNFDTECISFVLRFQKDIQTSIFYQSPDSAISDVFKDK
jgi:enamine deaminase RidA (YjgF/YER057c/UK114 family)